MKLQQSQLDQSEEKAKKTNKQANAQNKTNNCTKQTIANGFKPL